MSIAADLEARIERIEGQNERLVREVVALRRARRMHVLALALLLGGCLAVAAGTEKPDVLTARELRIESSGAARAVLGELDGAFSLRFYRGERKVLEIGSLAGAWQDSVPGLEAYDWNGLSQLRLSAQSGSRGPYGLLEFADVLRLRGGRELTTELFLRDTRPPEIFGHGTGYGTFRGAVFDFSGRSDVTILQDEGDG